MITQRNTKFFIAGNWKMNKTSHEAIIFTEFLHEKVGHQTDVNVCICPPFTALASLSSICSDSSIALGAQNMHPENAGAFTGEISPPMLRDLFVNYVIIGHSERRQIFKESDAFINEKVLAALEASLRPILCVGETQEERQAGRAIETIYTQLTEGLKSVPKNQADRLIIAYEPVWAIGTGKTASPEMAQVVHASIRNFLKTNYGKHADKISIIYGGSIKPDNAEALLSEEDIDGALIGGASLSEKSFLDIIKIAKKLTLQQQTPKLEEV